MHAVCHLRSVALGATFAASAAIFAISTTTFAQSKLYFTEYQFNNPKVKVMNLDGSNVQEVATLPTAQWLPIGLDIDLANNRIYWTNAVFNAGGIYRTQFGSATSTPLVSNQTFPFGLSLDLANGKMYWGDSSANMVQRANLDGTNVQPIFTGGQTWKPVVDPVNGYVYFAANEAIRRRSLDGTGPVQTVISGVSSVFAIALDVANNHIYWVDQQTTADHIARANLDDTNLTVLFDLSPDVFGSSALNDIRLDLAHGKMYFCDDLRTIIWSANLDGTNVQPIYTSPAGLAPSGLAFDVQPPQPMMDCNNNGIRDKDDIANATSADCNTNGIPDECETNPCVAPVFLLDQGLNSAATPRALGGASGWEVFQPFDVPAQGWSMGRISVHGYTENYNVAGFTATIFPDNGTGNFPNETQPLGSANMIFRVGGIWVSQPLTLSLPAGRHWVRLTANATYSAAVRIGVSGLPSISRSGSGNLFTNQPRIALRIIQGLPCDADINGSGTVNVADLLAVINGWGICGNCNLCPADVTNDCTVNVTDLLAVINAWGTCPQ